MISVLIGDTGFIGRHLTQGLHFDFYFNSQNIKTITNNSYDIIYCAAPTGNRLLVNQDPEKDRDNTNELISILSKTQTKRIVLIGTVDSLLMLNTAYGQNRKLLETFIKENFEKHHIIRLGTLIANNIEKNLLYDLKHKQWLSSINPDSALQWYPLENLIDDIHYVIDHDINELNLVSEPVLNLEIIQQFAPRYLNEITKKQNSVYYDVRPYKFSKQDILKHIQEYMK